MTATYIALANTTVPTGGLATVTFSNIPATYRDLVYVISGQLENATSTDTILRVNGDSGGNYSRVYSYGNGASVSTASETALNQFLPWYTRNNGSNAIGYVMDYSATDKHKVILARSNNASNEGTSMQTQRWANTAAITSLAFSSSTNEFAEGTTFALYGIVS